MSIFYYNQKFRGFTLVEMLVVIGIIAIFSTFTVINLNFQRTDRIIEKETGELYSSFFYARNLTISGKIFKNGSVPNGYGVHLESGKYGIFGDANATRAYDLNESIGLDHIVDSSIGITAVDQNGVAIALPLDIFFETPAGQGYFIDSVSAAENATDSIKIEIKLLSDSSQKQLISINKRAGQIYVIAN